jgi:hypothetical protein
MYQRPDDSLIESSLGSGGLSTRKLLLLTLLGVLLMATIGGTVYLLRTLPDASTTAHTNPPSTSTTSSISVVGTSSLSSTPNPTPSPTPTVTLAAQWHHDASLDTVLAIATAPSQPAIAYACYGVTANGRGVIGILQSSDGGTQWNTLTKDVAPGYDCAISVDPTNPQDIAMTVNPCAPMGCSTATDAFQALFRSHDGGVTWAHMALPASPIPEGLAGPMTWSGTTLFAQAQYDLSQPQDIAKVYPLAVSLNGGPLTWRNNPTINGKVAYMVLVAGLPHILYAGLQAQYSGSYACSGAPQVDLVASTNLGQSWSPATLADANGPLQFYFVDPSSNALAAVDAQNNTVVSFDGGLTWRQTPALAQNQGICGNFYIAPDGTCVANFITVNAAEPLQTLAAYIAAPGATAWHPLDPHNTLPTTILALTYDAQGHPYRLWAWLNTGMNGASQVWAYQF